MPVTLSLAAAALLGALLVGLPAGILAAVRRNSAVDLLTAALAVSGVSLPTFWLGVLLVYSAGCITDASTSPADRLGALLTMDAVLGLDLAAVARERETAPAAVVQAANDRLRERAALRLRDADGLRARFDGWRVDDHHGPAVLISDGKRRLGPRDQTRISSGAELPDWRAEPASCSWSVAIVSREYPDDLERCVALGPAVASGRRRGPRARSGFVERLRAPRGGARWRTSARRSGRPRSG